MRILVVEDNRQLVPTLFKHFEAKGCTLDVTPDGATGLHLALVNDYDYDVMILDWVLPRLEGPEVLKRLRVDHGSSLPVLMLTARDELPDRILGFRSGADDYLTKPFHLPEVDVRLEALVTRSKGAWARAGWLLEI